MSNLILVRVNYPTEAAALELARRALEEKLIACANLQGPVTSIYEWEGEVQSEAEWVLLMKTKETNWQAIETLVVANHPHDVPAILALPCDKVHTPFADWVRISTTQ